MPSSKGPKLHDGRRGAAIGVAVRLDERETGRIQLRSDGAVVLNVPPDEPDFNQAVKKMLAAALNVAIQQIDVIAGENVLEKLVAITGLDAEAVQQRLKVASR